MDLAGLAALLAVPSGVFAALWPALLDRAGLGRLERVEKLLDMSSTSGQHRELLEAVRNKLVERLALRHAAPRLRQEVGWMVWGYGYGTVMLAIGLLQLLGTPGADVPWFYWVVMGGSYVIGLVSTIRRWWKRDQWLTSQLGSPKGGS